ncbi:MAG: hypothetical protein QOJ53_477 [Sphingomonadales bacterium]|jgi:uncharacterized protein (DUF1697 family)|nr:hypothetical protein [Sphingomonadales bacterium]MEA3046145.1 hypothetical protein [Sphingomonadales bacterium]
MGRMVALLRAVNVGGRKLPMADLRALCGELGWTGVATYIQSGNLVFSAKGTPAALEGVLEEAIADRFGMAVPVVVRTAAIWSTYPPASPFSREPPNRVMLLLAKAPPAEGAEAVIEARAQAGERVRRVGDALWFHYPEGAGTSKLTPSLIDRAVGSPATARNYNTVLKLKEMLDG